MDELELLKKDWQANSRQVDQHITSEAIYPMLRKKSSSIVKTLFYISIAELVFWFIANVYPLFATAEYREELATIFGNKTSILIPLISTVIVIIFTYLLFKSYKSISVTDSPKTLIKNILNTRKIIKYYVISNITLLFLTFSIGMYQMINYNPEISQQFAQYSNKQMFIVTLIIILGIAIFLFAFWLCYRLIYGILLRRLNRNYKELKKMEV